MEIFASVMIQMICPLTCQSPHCCYLPALPVACILYKQYVLYIAVLVQFSHGFPLHWDCFLQR